MANFTRLNWLAGNIAWLSLFLAAAAPAPAESLPEVPEANCQTLGIERAVRWALENNPELAAIRQQHGIAAAGIVIARTYPFNPFWEAKVRDASGPASAGITNVLSNEHKVLMDVEVRHQGRYRRQAAYATLTRTDWEIAQQENNLAVRVIRAFDNVLYQQEKLRLLEQTVQLNQQGADNVGRLAKQGKLRGADLILARSEVDDSRAQLFIGRTPLATAQFELRKALGVLEGCLELQGNLETPAPSADPHELTDRAMNQRADLRARQAAVMEAEAQLRLTIANRYGNPNMGPAFEYDPTRISLIGAQLTLPLPVFNTQRGQIMQRQAERDRAGLDLRQTEIAVQQDVQASLARLATAQGALDTYNREILPNLESYLGKMQELFRLNDPGVDVLRVIDVRRKLIRARDSRLNALLEVSQARADLAAAVGDFTLALPVCVDQESVEVLPAFSSP